MEAFGAPRDCATAFPRNREPHGVVALDWNDLRILVSWVVRRALCRRKLDESLYPPNFKDCQASAVQDSRNSGSEVVNQTRPWCQLGAIRWHDRGCVDVVEPRMMCKSAGPGSSATSLHVSQLLDKRE
jgi:hypothetical protein